MAPRFLARGPGVTAYDIARQAGYVGTRLEFEYSLIPKYWIPSVAAEVLNDGENVYLNVLDWKIRNGAGKPPTGYLLLNGDGIVADGGAGGDAAGAGDFGGGPE